MFVQLQLLLLLVTNVDARLDVDRRTISGTVEYALENATSAPLTSAYVWLYPNRFAVRPRALTDVNFHWVYPTEFNAGWMTIDRGKAQPHALAGRGTLVRIALGEPIAPGATGRFRVTYKALVPERLGGFGCVDGTCTLAGGFYPMLAQLDAAGWDLGAPPMRSRFTGRLTLARAADVVVQGRPSEDVAVVDLRSRPAPYLAVVVAAARHRTVHVHRDVTITYLAKRARPPSSDASRQTLPYTSEDHAGMALSAAEQAVDLLAEIGAPLAAGTRLCFVEVPLRLELAQAHPGCVLVSDRLFRIFPARRFRKFHEQVLVRALYAEVLARTPVARDPELTAEAGASYLADLYTVREYRKQEFAREILSPVSFVPAVDQLIYAPQVAFSDAYFGAVADTDPFRDDPRRFANRRPNGHLFYKKLQDLLEPERFGEAMRAVVLGGALRPAAEAAHGESLAWFFRQWRAAAGAGYPRVNYAIGARSKERLASGAGWRHRVVVSKRATGALPAPVEPVEVRVVDGEGKRHALTWDGHGDEGAVELDSDSADVRLVHLDPRYRLVEATETTSSDDARFDDRSPARLKFLYNSFGALFNVSDGSLAVAFDFSIQRVHDIRNSLRLELFRTDSVPVGGVIGYSRYFGRKITQARLNGGWNVSLTAARLDFAGDTGTRASLAAGIGTDDRQVLFEPRRLSGWRLVARYSATRFDASGAEPADLRQVVSAYGEITRMVTPADGHTFVGEIDASAVRGDIKTRSQLLSLGGPGLLRGYPADELFGRARVTGHVEWRGLMFGELDFNLGHFAFVRRMGAAAFVDAGLLSGCKTYADLVSADALYASVGFGLRFFYDNFGVQPGMTAIDIAVPLVHRPRNCFDEPARTVTGTPFMIYLTFIPPF